MPTVSRLSWKDPRHSTRYPLALSVRFQTHGVVEQTIGAGVTRNLSSCGMFIETDREAEPGAQIKIIADWPVLLEGVVPLQFIALGEIVRCDPRGFGMRILRYEHRTRRKEAMGTMVPASIPLPASAAGSRSAPTPI
jgi:hypothetical protein